MVTLLSQLKRHGYLDDLHITLGNIGSRKRDAEDDYASLGWDVFAPNLTIYGFDADADACEAANADLMKRTVKWQEKHVPLALSDCVGEATLYVTQHPMCSSLYPPNAELLAHFDGLPEFVALDFTVDLETTTLDTFCQIEQVQSFDFLQIDVQGAELKVLQGARQILPTVLAIQVEVEFSPLYQNQPLFADIDAFLRAEGFTLFDLNPTYWKRARSPIFNPQRPGQILWGEAHYLRDLLQSSTREDVPDPERLLKLACIADIMRFPDYSMEILEHLTKTVGQTQPRYNFTQIITDLLMELGLSSEAIAALPLIQSLQNPSHTNLK